MENTNRIAELEKILAGWLFAPESAYNYYVELHNEWCELKGRTWEKKQLRNVNEKLE